MEAEANRLRQEVDSLHEQHSTMAATNQQLESLVHEARREAEQQRALADRVQREVERVREELSGQKQIAAVEENEERHSLEAEVGGGTAGAVRTAQCRVSTACFYIVVFEAQAC